MTAEELEKQHTLAHYRDAAGQAQVDRRKGERRLAARSVRCWFCNITTAIGDETTLLQAGWVLDAVIERQENMCPTCRERVDSL